MPYKGEVASGESLIWLENSRVLKEFKAKVTLRKDVVVTEPSTLNIERKKWLPRRVIAIDGSHILESIKNSYPGAEIGLLMTSVVAIKLDKLRDIKSNQIPRPSVFHDMENVCTVEAAMPGIGIVRESVENDTPINCFRESVYDALLGELAPDHETLLETLRHIVSAAELKPKFTCINEDCDEPYKIKKNKYQCEKCNEILYESDLLRLHEYFDGVRTSGEAIGRFRAVLEILVLLNILRFFVEKRPAYLKNCVFVLDGPLAIFGTTASILNPIRMELRRLNEIARQKNEQDIILFGIEKSGLFYQHWEQIDHCDEQGRRTKFTNGSIVVFNDEYIRNNIAPGKKPYGSDTHFGRTVLYKTLKGEHVVINTPMLNEESENFDKNTLECYPRLSEILSVMDELATYLYTDGFMPLVRAHANAAIPLRRGSDIIKSLIEDE